MEKPQILCHQEKPVQYTVYDVKWVPKVPRFVSIGVSASNQGLIELYTMQNGNFQPTRQLESSQAGLKCATFAASSASEPILATGDLKGHLLLWDLESGRSNEPISCYSKQRKTINCIDGVGGSSSSTCGAPEIATGSQDGTVMIWDTRQKNDPVMTIESDRVNRTRDCWTVAFGNNYNNDERMIAAGYDNGDIKIYDLRTAQVFYETRLKNGICCLEYDRRETKSNKLVAVTLESTITVFDLHLQKPHSKKGFAKLEQKTAEKATIWQVRHLPQNRDLFMTTSGSQNSLLLWKYEYPLKRSRVDNDSEPYAAIGQLHQLQKCSALSSQPINSFDWCRSKLGLAVCSSFDQTIRLLIVTKLKQFD